MNFADHFSSQAAAYRDFRPTYPQELFKVLAGLVDCRQLAWDCATGNGQAALALAGYFREVIATDASSAQLDRATLHPGIRYRTATAEASGLEKGSVDMITVAQALHWFDQERFFAEARRVAKPRGVLAVWVYGLVRIAPEVDRLIRAFFSGPLARYWPPERKLVDELYATVVLPGQEIPFLPQPVMQARWNLEHLCGYLSSWSAVARFRRAHGRDPLADLRPELDMAWSKGSRYKVAVWPLRLRACRLS